VVIALALLAIILFALIILVGFAYLQTKILAGVFQEYDQNTLPNKTVSPGDTYNPLSEDGLPLDQFIPNFKKPIKTIFRETPTGIEEESEGDDY